MNKGHILLFICCLILILSSYLTEAVPPVIQASDGDTQLTIVYPKDEYFLVNSTFNMYFHVVNLSDYLNNSQYSCILHMYDTQGAPIYEIDSIKSSGPWDIYFTINTTATKSIQTITYNVGCNSSRQVGYVSDSFMITQTSESVDESSPLIPVSLLLIFLPLLLIFSLKLIESDNIVYPFIKSLTYCTVIFYPLVISHAINKFTSNTVYSSLEHSILIFSTYYVYALMAFGVIWFLITLRNNGEELLNFFIRTFSKRRKFK